MKTGETTLIRFLRVLGKGTPWLENLDDVAALYFYGEEDDDNDESRFKGTTRFVHLTPQGYAAIKTCKEEIASDAVE